MEKLLILRLAVARIINGLTRGSWGERLVSGGWTTLVVVVIAVAILAVTFRSPIERFLWSQLPQQPQDYRASVESRAAAAIHDVLRLGREKVRADRLSYVRAGEKFAPELREHFDRLDLGECVTLDRDLPRIFRSRAVSVVVLCPTDGGARLIAEFSERLTRDELRKATFELIALATTLRAIERIPTGEIQQMLWTVVADQSGGS